MMSSASYACNPLIPTLTALNIHIKSVIRHLITERRWAPARQPEERSKITSTSRNDMCKLCSRERCQVTTGHGNTCAVPLGSYLEANIHVSPVQKISLAMAQVCKLTIH